MKITVYETNNCQRCRAVKRWLDKRGIEYDVVNASEDMQALEAIKALDYREAPVTIVNDGTGDIHFGGFNPDLLAKFCVPAA
ncbi:MAG TPA: glutaredoxin domain-containing protein [Enteractinococcus sp.]